MQFQLLVNLDTKEWEFQIATYFSGPEWHPHIANDI